MSRSDQQGDALAQLGVTAICQEPGYVFPDVLPVTRISSTRIELVSVRPADDESESSGNSGSYCPAVTMMQRVRSLSRRERPRDQVDTAA